MTTCSPIPSQDLEGLIEHPRPQPQPAAPIIEAPRGSPEILIGLSCPSMGMPTPRHGSGLKPRPTEKVGKDGEVVRLPEPQITQEQRLFVMRDDGVLFGEVSDPKVQPLANSPLSVHLPDRPRDDLLWRAYGVAAYRQAVGPSRRRSLSELSRSMTTSSTFIAPSMRSPPCADSRPA